MSTSVDVSYMRFLGKSGFKSMSTHFTVYEPSLTVNLVMLDDTDDLEDRCVVLDMFFRSQPRRFIPECNLDNRFSPDSNSQTLQNKRGGAHHSVSRLVI